MTREKLEAGVNLGPDRLSDTKNNAASQSAPEVAQPSDDNRFKSEDKAAAADGRIEACAHSKKDTRDGDHCESQRHSKAEDVRFVQPHKLGDILIVTDGPKTAP